MTQAVPLPPYQSANTSSLSRIIFDSVNCIQEVDLSLVQLKRKFSVVHFDANPKCTSSFESWWSTYISKTQTESAEEILDRILPDFQSTTSPVQEQKNFQPENSECHAQIAGEATKKRRNEGIHKTSKAIEHFQRLRIGQYTISQQQKFEGEEKDERLSKKAKRKLFLAGVPDITANNLPKSAINITKHSPGVHGSSHSSGDTVNFQKSVADVVVLDDTSSSTSPLSSDEDASPPRSDVKSPALKMSQYSAQVLNRTKAKVQKLLMMPLHNVVLPENYSVLVAALPIYAAASPNLSVEIARVLDELEKNLPSLFSNFQQAKWQQDKYYSKTAKKVILIDKLSKRQELYDDLKQHHIEIDTRISNLKASLKKAKMKKRAIEEQELNLENEISPVLAALEELSSGFLDSKKDLADSLTTQAEASWADYKQKITDLGM